MSTVLWNEIGVNKILESKDSWSKPRSITDPYGNHIEYFVVLTPYTSDLRYVINLTYMKFNFVTITVWYNEIDSDQKITHVIDEFFKRTDYKNLMSSKGIPQYVAKVVTPPESPQDTHISDGLNQMLAELNEKGIGEELVYINKTKTNVVGRDFLIKKYTKDLQDLLSA